ncbi:hypothetical protein [Gloeocapsa sp. PCC 73106]|uniref:hypothetical protein n=1 Tax=Gloeocapsa sp. PCC 73106 TaxID=102232 RepID=UPI0002ABA89A|nr:hypothetical protein [Gloeocapsa sp. PCC 73106]ELR99267.1 hypothetical protein GLO73106DRAFT_00031170 [Gloeocapsa sp. PCC 73106]
MTTFLMSTTPKSRPIESIIDSDLESPQIIENSGKTELDQQTASVQEHEENEHFFQAIATLYGNIEQDKELGYIIKIAGVSYRLFIFPAKYRGWLKQIENHPDQPLYLRVYPKYQIIPRKDPEIYFQVVAWAEENQWSEPGVYLFRGIWQFVPQVRTPVISIYRNRGSKDYTEKFKATHLPILMRREDQAAPFRFNPKIKKEDLPVRWFIQAKFKFIPSKNCWGWLEDLEPPTQEIPRYKKPIKADAKPQEYTKVEHTKSVAQQPLTQVTKPKPKTKPQLETD